MRDGTAKRLSAVHKQLFRATGGRVGRRLLDNDMLLLTTSGRRTGREHTVPLLYLPDAGNVVVIASWGGRDYPPDWYVNVVAEPRVRVQIQSERWTGTATEIKEPERSEWWQQAVAAYDGYHEYQTRTERVIPVIRVQRFVD